MLRELASVVIVQSLDLVTLAARAAGRAASVGFLRLSTLFLAQAFDLVTFSLMVARRGVRAEANPIVSDLFMSHGMAAVIIAKLVLVILVGALFVAAASRGRRGVWSLVGGIPLAIAIAAGLIGGITNAAAYLH